jgi:hypothetical protein
VALGFAVLGSVALAQPAAADSKSWTCVGVYGGEACFRSYGDDLAANDTVADGRRAVVKWHVNYSRSTPDCVDKNGANNGKRICYHDMREGKTIAFRVVIMDGSTPIRASDSVEMEI